MSDIPSGTAGVISSPIIAGLRAAEVGVRMRLFEDAATLQGGSKREQVFGLLRRHEFIYSKEGHVLGITGLSAHIADLRDEGYSIDTLRQGRQAQYVLKSATPDEALKAARAKEKKERSGYLEDDKESGYHAAGIKETDALTLVSPT